MSRWGRPTKNKKRGNPRYFLNETVEHNVLFERHEYITNTLGIMPLLSESGRAYYPSEMRQRILEEHLLFEGFFDRFNPINAIKKYGKEVGDLFGSLYRLIREPRFIPQYVRALARKIIKPLSNSLEQLAKWMEQKQMPTFAGGIRKIMSGIDKLFDMSGWKQALAITGAVLGLHYIKGKFKTLLGMDVVGQGKSEVSVFEKVSSEAWNAAENFLMKEFPKQAAKLYGGAALAASTGFLGWMVGAAAVLKVVNFAKDALKGALSRFKNKVDRTKRREAAAAAGGGGPVLNRDEDY